MDQPHNLTVDQNEVRNTVIRKNGSGRLRSPRLEERGGQFVWFLFLPFGRGFLLVRRPFFSLLASKFPHTRPPSIQHHGGSLFSLLLLLRKLNPKLARVRGRRGWQPLVEEEESPKLSLSR